MDRRIDGTYVYFDLLDMPKKKTQTWQVMSRRGVHLGDIKWLAQWREYAFFPDEETVYESTCLGEISAFIQDLMSKRKKGNR